MPDREKVISMLKCIVNLESVYVADCKRRECPYAGTECMRAVAADALALLKEQEARVMTREEIRTGEIETLWIEVKGKPHIFPGIWYRRSKKDGIPAIDITLNTGIVRGTVVSYGYAWRCWTSRPSPEQMRETKWEGDKDEKPI